MRHRLVLSLMLIQRSLSGPWYTRRTWTRCRIRSDKNSLGFRMWCPKSHR